MSDTKPADEIRIGRVKATIWMNTAEDGAPRYNVVFSRLYREGEQWKTTHSFGPNDLLLLGKVADIAHTRVSALRQDDRAETARGGNGGITAWLVLTSGRHPLSTGGRSLDDPRSGPSGSRSAPGIGGTTTRYRRSTPSPSARMPPSPMSVITALSPSPTLCGSVSGATPTRPGKPSIR